MSRVQFKLSAQLVAALAANIPPEARSAFAELVLGQVLNAPPTLRHARVRLGLPAYYCSEQTQELADPGGFWTSTFPRRHQQFWESNRPS
jgi:hypothetical protein